MTGELDRGRECFRRQAWEEAFALLSAADRESALAPADLQLLATAAYLIGKDGAGGQVLARAYGAALAADDPIGAARSAFWLGFHLLHAGDAGQAGGWLGRARRLLDDGAQPCAERGYLLVPTAVAKYVEGDYGSTYDLATEAAEIGHRFADLDLVTLARHVQSRALIRQGRPADAMTLLDEAMVTVLAGEVSAVVAGDTYCGAIEACHEVFDLGRAREWTAALSRWCDAQPALALFRGQCLVHRTQIMQLLGDWPDALEEAHQACRRLSEQPAAGAAFYQLAELHRLCGAFEAAEDAFRQASRRGREPQPGLALLRLAQGQVGAAAAASRRVLDEAGDRLDRSRLLPAHTEIMLAADDVAAARAGADELMETADDVGAPALRGAALHATGAVLLAEGDGRRAAQVLRRAWAAWHDIGAPYEAARARVLLGRACRLLGDDDGAVMEFDAARWAFERLGAVHDLALTETLARPATTAPAGGLTRREAQVLRLVAAGKTNRAIAAELFLSEKTVARHVSNIFTKLGLSSRSAATGYAYEHGLT